jgi:hypothetical protein
MAKNETKRERVHEIIKRDVLLYLCIRGESINKDIATELKINKGQISRAVKDLKPYLNIRAATGGSHPTSLRYTLPAFQMVLDAASRDSRSRYAVTHSQYHLILSTKLVHEFLHDPGIIELYRFAWRLYIDDPRQREEPYTTIDGGWDRDVLEKESHIFCRAIAGNWFFLRFVVQYLSEDIDEKKTMLSQVESLMHHTRLAWFKSGFFAGLESAQDNITDQDDAYIKYINKTKIHESPLDYLVTIFKDLNLTFDAFPSLFDYSQERNKSYK